MTPEQIAAAIRDPESGLYPSNITVFCDGCGYLATRDYLVREGDGVNARLAVARTLLRENERWQCDAYGDFCPDCIATDWVGEDGPDGGA